jgi:hypothetical protein
VTNLSTFKRPWDVPNTGCIAYRKVGPDNRNFDWHVEF